jgi:hypothetical protein
MWWLQNGCDRVYKVFGVDAHKLQVLSTLERGCDTTL